MKKITILLASCFYFLFLSTPVKAQSDYEDVVYLKNGSVIHGIIIEQIYGQTVKIKTRDGNIFVYKAEEIEKITREEVKSSKDNKKELGIAQLHNGFQLSLYGGGAVGDVKGSGKGIGRVTFGGASMHMMLHIGYSYNNFSYGLAAGFNSLTPTSFIINNKAYSPADILSIDNNLLGIYLKKSFMPHNFFVAAEGGIGKFSLYIQNQLQPFYTQHGFAWSIKAGKEFVVGKKKKFGLGGFVSLSGIRCYDSPPNSSDLYKYIGPGIGLVVSYH